MYKMIRSLAMMWNRGLKHHRKRVIFSYTGQVREKKSLITAVARPLDASSLLSARANQSWRRQSLSSQSFSWWVQPVVYCTNRVSISSTTHPFIHLLQPQVFQLFWIQWLWNISYGRRSVSFQLNEYERTFFIKFFLASLLGLFHLIKDFFSLAEIASEAPFASLKVSEKLFDWTFF